MPRKTSTAGSASRRSGRASMRPRPDAAENRLFTQTFTDAGSCFNEAAARCRGKRGSDRGPGRQRQAGASMRPRPDAAENGRAREPGARHPGCASMRPRPDAAENPARQLLQPGAQIASMRPRPDAAENAVSVPRTARAARSFNEAAARCRGKHAVSDAPVRPRPASMRPRPDAAENPDPRLPPPRRRAGLQ